MSTRHGFALLPIIIIVLTIVGIASVFGYKYYQKNYGPKSARQADSQITAVDKNGKPINFRSYTPPPVQTPDPTVHTDAGSANWKTYYGKDFSIKYPPDFTILPSVFYSGAIFNFPKGTTETCSAIIQIGVKVIPEGMTIPQALDKGDTPVGGIPGGQTVGPFKNVFVDGVQGVGNNVASGCDAYEVHVLKNNKLYGFFLSNWDASENGQPRHIFNQMLSTFKFTSNNALSWKTFKGKNYSIKYPQDWSLDENGIFKSSDYEISPQGYPRKGYSVEIVYGSKLPFDDKTPGLVSTNVINCRGYISTLQVFKYEANNLVLTSNFLNSNSFQMILTASSDETRDTATTLFLDVAETLK